MSDELQRTRTQQVRCPAAGLVFRKQELIIGRSIELREEGTDGRMYR